MIFSGYRFNNWAQPVTDKRWALIAVTLHFIARNTGYKIITGHHCHMAWQKAVGVDGQEIK